MSVLDRNWRFLTISAHSASLVRGKTGWIRKPLFCPLNYGNNDLERINGLNGDGQDTLAMRSDFFGGLSSRLSAPYLRVSSRRAFPCESKWLPRLKKKLCWKSRMCYSRTSSVTPSCRSISNER